MKCSRYLLLLLLFVFTQACAATQVNPPTGSLAKGLRTARSARTQVKQLSDCAGDRFQIDLLDAITKIPDDTLDAQREQLRDWIFTLTLARIAQTAGVDEVMTGILTEPVFRDDSLAHVLRMQSGPTRSTATKSGDVIVMVEAADAATMSAEVVESVDDEALHLGSTPEQTQVYQYVFHSEVARAEVCAMKPLARGDIENAARQYRTATITTAAEFERFLAGGVDLLSAQCTEAGLQVQGRQRPRTGRTPITVEHIAALSQARGTRYVPVERFGYSMDRESAKNRAILDHNARIVDDPKTQIDIQEPDVQIVAMWKRQNPKVPTQNMFVSLGLLKENFGRPGFSLDPTVNIKFTTYLLDELIAAAPDVHKVAAIYRGLHEDNRAKDIEEMAEWTREPFAVQAKAILVDVRAKLAKAKPEEAEAILYKTLTGSLGKSVAEDMLRVVGKHGSQQCSRYDGPFYGTATGMTFFYTDLLAKIWAIDWNGAAPEMDIEGFRADTHGELSTTSCENDKSSQNTRTWLGLREENFTREASGAVRFAPVATRVFVKGSNAGARNVEFEASAEAVHFANWWNSHYGTIADWEPQYEVLNQIMKWSVVVEQANVAKNDACLAALDGVTVRADHRIDKWVADNESLRWRGPVNLLKGPNGRAAQPGDRECMELLESKAFPFCGSMHSIAGGVSAASRAMIMGKPIRAAQSARALGRLNSEAKVVQAASTSMELAEVVRPTGKLTKVRVDFTPVKASFQAEVDVAASQRSIGISWDKGGAARSIAKDIERGSQRVAIHERRNGLVTSELTASDLAAAEPKIIIETGPLAKAQAKTHDIVKRMARDGVSPLAAAKQEFSAADHVIELGDNAVAWRIPNSGASPKYAVMKSGSGIRGPPNAAEARFSVGVSNVSGRAGASEAFAKPIVETEIVSESTVKRLVAEQRGKPLDLADSRLEAIRGKLAANDVDGAVKALSTESTEKHYAAVLEHAMAKGDDANVAQIVKHAVGNGSSPAHMRAMRGQLELEVARRTRAGLATDAVDQQIMKLAIAERKQQAVAKVAASPVKDASAAVYTPPGYSAGAELPPAVHAPSKVLAPNEKFVTRTLDEVSVAKAPAEVEVNGLKLARQREGAPTAAEHIAVGSALRLLSGGRTRVHVVIPCNDQDTTMAPCHERPSPEQRARIQEAMQCDLNGDQDLAGPEEINCLDAQRKKKEAEEKTEKQK